MVNDKIMGSDSEHDRNVICVKVGYYIEEPAPGVPGTAAREKKLPYDQTAITSPTARNQRAHDNLPVTYELELDR